MWLAGGYVTAVLVVALAGPYVWPGRFPAKVFVPIAALGGAAALVVGLMLVARRRRLGRLVRIPSDHPSSERTPLVQAALRGLRNLVVSVVIGGGTVVFGVGPLLAGPQLLGRPVGLSVGAGVAAVAMVIVVWAATRYPSVPGGFAAGMIAFVLGIVMIFFATVDGAFELIPSHVVAAVVGVIAGAALVTGLIFTARRRGMWARASGDPVGPAAFPYF